MIKEIKRIDELEFKVVALSELVTLYQNDNIRSSLALREALETAKPIKPNNWDSVKQAFKGPVRIDINERA